MKRLQARTSALTVVWVGVGIVLFAVLWALIKGGSPATSGVAGVGLLLFMVAGAVYGGEVNLAIKAVNLRVDDCIQHDTTSRQVEMRPGEGPR